MSERRVCTQTCVVCTATGGGAPGGRNPPPNPPRVLACRLPHSIRSNCSLCSSSSASICMLKRFSLFIVPKCSSEDCTLATLLGRVSFLLLYLIVLVYTAHTRIHVYMYVCTCMHTYMYMYACIHVRMHCFFLPSFFISLTRINTCILECHTMYGSLHTSSHYAGVE